MGGVLLALPRAPPYHQRMHKEWTRLGSFKMQKEHMHEDALQRTLDDHLLPK